MRILSVLLVLKKSFDWTNLSFFLIFFIILECQNYSWTLTSYYYFYDLIFVKYFYWEFSDHICVVGFRPVCSNWLDQSSLILNFLGYVRTLSVGRIQTVHTDLLPLQVSWRLWWGFWLVVQNCSHQLIALIDINSPSSS